MAPIRRRQCLQWLPAPLAGAVLGSFSGVAALAAVAPPDQPEASQNWQKIRASLFADRRIEAAGNDTIELETPVRAEDAAVVPVAVRSRLPADGKLRVDKLWLVIDNNPSPIAGIFEFGQRAARPELETRIRIDEYTHVRAIAQLSDGRTVMATRFVKASGGCSAPPGKDAQAALATLGRMKLHVEPPVAIGKPALAQLMISHPNHSGLAMDQLSRQYTPAHYVRDLKISYRGQPVLSGDVDISISENPNFRFWFTPDAPGELTVDIVDNRDKHFGSSLAVSPDA